MNKVRKFSLLVLVLFVMAGGFLAGCGDKYKNMSVTSDAQQGLTLYVGDEEANTGKITFTVNGAGDKISTDLVFSFKSHEEDRIVEIVDPPEKDGNKTTVTLRALDTSNGGETTLVALTKEGNKSTSVKISCVIKANSMKTNTNYKPLIVAGNSMTINASDALVFDPSGTTQKHIKFTLANQLQGVSISESGLLVVEKDATATSVDILATNLDNSSLEDQTITVKIIRAVEKEDVVIKDANGNVVTAINLSTNRVNESSIMLRAYITNDSDENYITNFSLVATSDTTLSDTSCATIEKIGGGSDVVVRAIDKGSCLLKVSVKVQGYDAIVQEITLPVVCDELPSSISVNGNIENYELEIYSKYNNTLGTKFVTIIGSEFVDDKRYVLQLDKSQEENVKILREDRTELKPMIVDGENINDDFDIIDSGSVIYVQGLNANAKTLLRFVAYASIGHEDETAITVTLTTLIGAESLDVKFVDTDKAIRTNTVFVEEGKSVSVGYEADNENASTKGILVVENSDNKLISAVVEDGENPLITITGLKAGISSAKLVLPNGTETRDFSIYVFKPVADVFASVDSPLDNKNIAQADYKNGSLSKFVMSLGTGTAVKFSTEPDDGTIYDINCVAENADNTNVISVSSSGYIVSKNVGTATVNVTIKTLKTQNNGTVAVVELTLTFDVVVYIPISSISLSRKTATLIWKEDTNYTQYQNKEHITKLDLSIFPRSAYVEADQISWVASNGAGNFLELTPSADGRSCEVLASRGDVEQTTMIATVKAFVTLYGTTISQSCIITIVKPQKVTDIAVNIQGQTDNKTMYFDSRKGLSTNEGAFDANGVAPKTIVTTVLPENATNKTIKYANYDSDIVYIDEQGNVYPLSAGKTTITVFAEDKQNWLGEITDSYREITVIVADGKTEDTAFLISNEADFIAIKNGLNYFYSLTDNILLTNPISCMGTFGGVLNGNGHYLQNVSFEGAKNYLFDAITTPDGENRYCDQATVKDLNITANVNLTNSNETFEFAVLAKQNNAMINNVKVSLGNAKVTNTYANANIYFAGLVIENNYYIMNSSMTGNIVIEADTQTNIKNLEVAGLVGTNNNYIYGGHNNYQYANSYLISFDALGSITVNNLTAENSYIGGLVAKNIHTVGSSNTSSGYGSGIATSIKINAPTINNVGGLVGYNEGTIYNSLSYGDIHANNNVGGLVGVEAYNGSMQDVIKIDSSIVELYQDPLDDTYYAGIVGNDNVGGLIGFAKGSIIRDDQGTISDAYSITIKNSYVRSYNAKSYVSSQNIAGGLIGRAGAVDISSCYANVSVDGKIVGGLIGQVAEGDVDVLNAFSRVTFVNKDSAEVIGSFAGEILATTTLTNFYTTTLDTAFVGKDESALFTQTNSFRLVSTSADSSGKTSDELKTLSTYENAGWSISADIDNEKQWCLTNETSRYNYNDGYPSLLMGRYVLDKEQASKIYVTPKSNTQKINDSFIVLRTGKEYNLNEVLNVRTNISGASRMVVISNKDGVLKNCDQSVFSSLSSILSTSEDIITLTFKLYSNADIECKIQIAFVKPIEKVQLSRSALSLKKGKSGTFTGMFLDENDNLIQANNYLLGANISKLETETSSYTDYFEFSQIVTTQNGIVYTNNPAIVKSKGAIETLVEIDVYAKLNYVDLTGEEQNEYLKVNSIGASLEIDIYEGASQISVNRANIDMTLMNVISLQVTIATDIDNERLFVYENSEDKINYIQVDSNDSNVVSKNISNVNDYKLKLSVTGKDYNSADKQYTFTFNLQFLDEYLSLTDSKEFAKALATSLRFVPESNENLDAVVQISAKPQSLLKIDLNHFPSGQSSIKADSNGKTYNAYTPTEFPSNTLTPGQVGLLSIDLYPEYSLFDELTITSSKNSNGDAISFIQVIFFETENDETTRYMEIKPNPVIVENGIVLTKQSYTNEQIGISNSKYNGTLYVKTLISTRVPNQQVFTVTVSCYNYIEENGQIVKQKVIDKSIDLIISPKPDVSIRVAEKDTHTSFIYQKNHGQVIESKEYNVIARGTVQNIITELKNYAVPDLTYSCTAYRDYIDENNNKQSKALSAGSWGNFVENSSAYAGNISIGNGATIGYLEVYSSTPAGTRIVLSATAKKTINGIEETYSSENIEFYVVDYILTDVNVASANQSKILSLNVSTARNMNAKFATINASITGDADNDTYAQEITDKIEKDQKLISKNDGFNSKYWFAVSKKNGIETLTNWQDGSEYNSGDPKYKILTDNQSYLLYAKREAKLSENVQFKIKFAYYYSFELDSSKFEMAFDEADIDSANLIDSNITLEINQTTSIDNPYPIYTISEFLSMDQDKDYILMNDLQFGVENVQDVTTQTSSAYTPFALNVKSFDGNCKNITINSNNGQIFNFSGETTENLGLFATVASGTIVKNVYVIYANAGTVNLTGTGATALNFGGIAGINNGIITNCIVTFKSSLNTATADNNGNITFETEDNVSTNIAGFVGDNNGMITYSTVTAANGISKLSNGFDINPYQNATISAKGNVSGFVSQNSNLISNCQVLYVGISNQTGQNLGSRTAGFVSTNTGNIYYSSVEGQYLPVGTNSHLKQEELFQTVGENDSRIDVLENANQKVAGIFARIHSNGNVAGFVYNNSGAIKDSYTNMPMDTQSRTSGFVFSNTGNATILSSYTLSYYDGAIQSSTANTPFVGTNELGEVQNDDTCQIKFCYYVSDKSFTELDKTFADPATRISFEDAGRVENYVGFDNGSTDYTTWGRNDAKSNVMYLVANKYNSEISQNFARKLKTISSEDENESYVYIPKNEDIVEGDENCPILIATADQFVDRFKSSALVFNNSFRLINNIDMSTLTDATSINNLQTKIFAGDLDGNGMEISGVRIVGASSTTKGQEADQIIADSSYGLFKQIGTYDKNGGGNGNSELTHIRNIKFSVEEISKSTSTFTGILAGIIINTALKDVEINTQNLTVLGKNITGGVAGAILENSTLYNVSSNANVTSAYVSLENDEYQANFESKVSHFKNTLTSENHTKLDKSNGTTSYAGGIAGVIDIKPRASVYDCLYTNISRRNSNVDMVTVKGDIAITGEIVGGVSGYLGADTYISNSQFEVSTNDSQRLKGYYVAGGLVGENYGVINLCKVEVNYTSVNAFDNATNNNTGNNLFENEDTNPVYIGGLVGVNYGGYITTSYSKTNVYNHNASFAGGLIGLATNNGKLPENAKDKEDFKNYRPTILKEVYTTGNVFAGANGILGEVTTDENEIQKADFTSTNHAGGLFGKYEAYYIPDSFNMMSKTGEVFRYADIDDSGNFINLEHAFGLNGFHKPQTYNVQNGYRQYENGRISKITFADLATGFTERVTLSNGTIRLIDHDATIGAFAGEISINNGTSNEKVIKNVGFDTEAIFVNYVYNDGQISVSSATSANGSQINYIAKITNNTDGNISIEAQHIKGSNKYTFIAETNHSSTVFAGYRTGVFSSLNINVNSNYVDNDTNDYYIAPNNEYLLYRGLDVGRFVVIEDGKVTNQVKSNTYQSFKNTIDGLYTGWNVLYWEFANPVYPKFAAKDTSEYMYIEKEDQLRSIQSGSKYILTADIYLSKPWTPKEFVGTLIGASRVSDDGFGIAGSSHYAIYNINITSPDAAVGFFTNFDRAEVSNINFVFGTRIDPSKLSNQDGWKDKSWTDNFDTDSTGIKFGRDTVQSYNVGSIAAVVNSTSKIGSCQVYYVNNVIETYSDGTKATKEVHSSISNGTLPSGDKTTISVGGLVGKISGKSAITNSGVSYVDYSTENKGISYVSDEHNVIDLKDIPSNATLDVGGIVGNMDTSSSISKVEVKGVNIGTLNTYQTSVGGVVGNIHVPESTKTGSIRQGEVRNASVSGVTIKVVGKTFDAVKDDNGEDIIGYNQIGGIIGIIKNMSNNGENVTTKLTLSDNSVKKLNEILLSGTFKTPVYVGGAVGAMSNSELNTFEISDMKISAKDNAEFISTISFGGICGYAQVGQQSINSCYTSNVDIDVANGLSKLKNESAIGGMLGKFDEAITISGGEVSGVITTGLTPDAGGMFVAGIVGYSTSDAKLEIKNFVSVVEINIKQMSNNLTASGAYNLKVDELNSANGSSATLNQLLVAGEINANVYGNASVYGLSNVNKLSGPRNIYCLTTLKLYGPNVYETVVGGSKSINYYQNISGQFRKDTTNTNLSTYFELCKSIRESFNNDSRVKEMNKVNPISINAREVTTLETGKYYYVNSDVDNLLNKLDGNIVDCNIIANETGSSNVISLPSPISIADGSMISGVEFKLSNNFGGKTPIEENKGFIFNTFISGNIKLSEVADGKKHVSGFVGTNSGTIVSSGTMVEIDVNKQANVYASGFATTNNGLIASSFATGLIENMNYDSENIAQSGNFGFVENSIRRLSAIVNSYSATSIFDVVVENNSTVKHYENTFAFNGKDYVGNTANCYYDKQSSSNSNEISAVEAINYSELSAREDGDRGTKTTESNVFGTVKQTLFAIKSGYNFEYPMPLTYQPTGGITGTGKTEKDRIVVNNIGRLSSLKDVFTNIDGTTFVKIRNNIDASLNTTVLIAGGKALEIPLPIESLVNENGGIDVTANSQVSIYGAKLNPSFVNVDQKTTGIVGMFSSTKNGSSISVTNVGIVGQMNVSTIVTVKMIIGENHGLPVFKDVKYTQYASYLGLLVGKSETTKLENCYAVLSEQFVYPDISTTLLNVVAPGNKVSVGILAGYISENGQAKNSYIKNSFAKGDIKFDLKYGDAEYVLGHTIYNPVDAYIGGLVGYNNNVAIEKCFASGTINISSGQGANVNGDFSIGGFIGKAENKPKVENSYSNVSVLNYTTDGWDKYHFGPIIGSGGVSNEVQQNTRILQKGEIEEYGLQKTIISSSVLTLQQLYAERTKFEKSVRVEVEKYVNEVCVNAIVRDYLVSVDIIDINKIVNTYTYTFFVSKVRFTVYNNVYYDKGVALQKDDNFYDDALSKFMTNEVTPFEDGNASKTHLPIQKVFKNNYIVYTLLEIDDTVVTGSKMSPVGVDDINDVGNISEKYIYLTQDSTVEAGTRLDWNDKVINLNGHTITRKGEVVSGTQNNSKIDFDNSIVANGEIKNEGTNLEKSNPIGAFGTIKKSYVYGINSTGEMKGYGFVAYSDDSVLDNCSVNGTIYISNRDASAFAMEAANNSIFRDVQIGNEKQTSIKLTQAISTQNHIQLAGVLLYDDGKASNTAYIIGANINDLSFENKAGSKVVAGEAYIGGIMDQVGSNNKVKIYGDISIKKLSNTIVFDDPYDFEMTGSSSIYFGGIAGVADDNGSVSSYDFVMLDKVDLSCRVSQKFYIGAMFGAWCKTSDENDSFSKKVVKSDINITTTGDAYEVSVGLIGAIPDYWSISLADIDMSDVSFTVVNSAKNGESDIKYNFGGVIGKVFSKQFVAEKIYSPHLVKFETSKKSTNCIGGIIGKIVKGEDGVKLDESISHNVHCKVSYTGASNTFVGGFVGFDDGETEMTGESSGDVIATSSAQKGVEEYTVKDARTMELMTGKDGGESVNYQVITEWFNDYKGRVISSMYANKQVSIPLAVGGFAGYTRSFCNGASKTGGSVRALLTNCDSSFASYLPPVYNYSKDNLPTRYHAEDYELKRNDETYYHERYKAALKNNEELQCRAGAYAGLMPNGILANNTFSWTHAMNEYGSFKFETNGLKFIGIPVKDGKGNYLGYINVYKGDLNIERYSMPSCNLPISYGNNLEKYNYNLFSNQDASYLSQSNYNEGNIFNDKSLDYVTYEYTNHLEFKRQGSDIIYDKDHVIYKMKNGGQVKDSVFAGFVYDGVTYNRSYWSMGMQDKAGYSYLFNVIPHWAGSIVGGALEYFL